MLRFNIQMLSKYWKLFNYRKLICIATDNRSMTFEQASKYLKDQGISGADFLCKNNSRRNGEAEYLLELLQHLTKSNDDEIVFYAHAKGVCRKRPVKVLKTWISCMYGANLNDLKLIESCFEEHDCAGTFRFKSNKGSSTPWFYAGNFYWFKSSALFNKYHWHKIDIKNKKRWAAEQYIGSVIPIEKSAEVGYPFPGWGPSMYTEEAYTNIGIPLYGAADWA